MDLRMTGENILISIPEAAPEARPSGLIVPDSATSHLVEALVMAVGPGRVLDGGALAKPEVAVGDWVLVPKNGGEEVERGGHTFRLITPAYVKAIVDKPYAAQD